MKKPEAQPEAYVLEQIHEFKVVNIADNLKELEELLTAGWRIDSGWQNPKGTLFILTKYLPGTLVDGKVVM